MIAPLNRIAGLLEDMPSAPKPRSPAQQEASRRNGARSRGPATAAGKAKSRLNALKHGLLARVIAPSGEDEQHSRLFGQVRRELIQELQPTGFIHFATIDLLAHDYVRLARVRQMIEAALQPPTLSREHAEPWQKVQACRRHLRLLEPVLARMAAGEPAFCRPRKAQRVAEKVVTYVQDRRAWLAEVEAEEKEVGPTEGTPDPFEEKELRETRELMAFIRPVEKKLTDAVHVAAVLSGTHLAGRKTFQRLQRVLEAMVAWYQGWLHQHCELAERVQRAQRQALAAQARTPEPLLVLERYSRTLERSIERKLRQLRPR